MDVGGEAGGIVALLLLDHFVVFGPTSLSIASPALLVGLPLLLLRVADPH